MPVKRRKSPGKDSKNTKNSEKPSVPLGPGGLPLPAEERARLTSKMIYHEEAEKAIREARKAAEPQEGKDAETAGPPGKALKATFAQLPAPRKYTLKALGRDEELAKVDRSPTELVDLYTFNDAFRVLMEDMAAEIKEGERAVPLILEDYDISAKEYNTLIDNIKEFADACGAQKYTFRWDKKKFEVAFSLAEGLTRREIHDVHGVVPLTVDKWLRNIEYSKYVDELIMEMGFANKRTRVAALQRVSEKLMGTLLNKFERMTSAEQLDAESMKGLLSEFREYNKLIAEEKRDFVQVVKSDVALSGDLKLDQTVKQVENYLGDLNDEERAEAERKLKEQADEIISRYNT